MHSEARFRRPASVRPRPRAARPRDRRKHAENNLPPQTAAPALPRKPASRHQVPQAHQRPARRPSSNPGTPPPLRYSPARQGPPHKRAGRETTRRRQSWPRHRAPGGGPRTDASRLRPPQQAEHGCLPAGQRKQPAAPQDGIPRPEPGPTIPIGLDLFHDWSRPRPRRYQHGFSTRSGNDGKQPAHSEQTGHKTGLVHSGADRPVSRVYGRYIRRSGYRTSSPVIVRPISIRWLSDVPSKMVKILEDMGRVIGIPAWPPIGAYG
jgi:hypothetical protein